MLIIHGVPLSVHTRKVILAALVKGLEHRVEPVIPFDPPPGWDELSPTGLIPVLEDGDLALPDSTAICLYLERKHPQPPLLPAEPGAYGRALFLDAYAGGSLFRGLVHGLFFQKVIRPQMLGETTDSAIVEQLMAETAPKLFGWLEKQAGGPFLVGGALSLADLSVASNLINYHYLGLRIDAAAFPALAAWLQGVLGRPAFVQALEAERPFAEAMGLDLGWTGDLARRASAPAL